MNENSYTNRYSPDNVKTMQQEEVCQESEKTTTKTEVTSRTTDVERLLLTTDKFVHMLSMPLDLSAHHKFEHACSHMKEKISRHCENVERRCSSYETFLDSVLRRQKKAREQTKEIESRLNSEWKQLKRSYAPLLT